LSNNNIGVNSKDKIEPALDSEINDKDTITIKRAVNIKVAVDGKELDIQSAEENIDSMLKAEGIILGAEDRVKPDKGLVLSEEMQVEIIRVETKTITENLPITFKEVVKTDSSMSNTKRKTAQEGKNGEKQVTTNIVYENGKEVSRNIVSEIVKSEPVQAIIKVGTLGVVKSNRGDRVLYKSKVTAKATAYTDSLRFGITASGAPVKRDADGYSSIAVDPRVIPLGTKLYIPGYGYGIAQDTGGLIKGNRIDLFYNSESECYNWGVRDVDVYILK
jgi:3D (Asp-Asp-Asp) domain-containing protein